MAKGIKDVFLLITGFITCPCHLPFVLPALAGTALGAFIADNKGLLIALATIYFVGVIIYFLRRTPGIERQEESKKGGLS